MSDYQEGLKRAMEEMYNTEYGEVSTPSNTKMTKKQVKARNKSKASKKARKKQRR
jgi:hypothetical protein